MPSVVPAGQIAFSCGRVNILADMGRGYFVADAPSGPFVKARAELPPGYDPTLFASSIYGTVFTSGPNTEFFEVIVEPPETPFDRAWGQEADHVEENDARSSAPARR